MISLYSSSAKLWKLAWFWGAIFFLAGCEEHSLTTPTSPLSIQPGNQSTQSATVTPAGKTQEATASNSAPFKMPKFVEIGEVQKEYIWDLSWSPDSKTLAFAGSENSNTHGAWLYEARTFKELWFSQAVSATSVAFGSDGAAIAVTTNYGPFDHTIKSEDGTVIQKAASSKICRGGEKTLQGSDDIAISGYATFEPFHTHIYKWNTRTGDCLGEVDTRDGYFASLFISKNGDTLGATIGDRDDPHVYLWDLKTDKMICKIDGYAWAQDFYPIDNTVAIKSGDHKIELWDPRACNSIKSWSFEGISAGFSPDGRIILIQNHTYVEIWDKEKEIKVAELGEYKYGEDKMSFSPDGHYLALIATGESGVLPYKLIIFKIE